MRKPQRENEQTIGEALKYMISELKLETKLLETKTETLWAEIMGARIEKFTEKVTVRKQVMYVYLSSPELRNELSYGKTKILEMINEALDEDYLKEVKFI